VFLCKQLKRLRREESSGTEAANPLGVYLRRVIGGLCRRHGIDALNVVGFLGNCLRWENYRPSRRGTGRGEAGEACDEEDGGKERFQVTPSVCGSRWLPSESRQTRQGIGPAVGTDPRIVMPYLSRAA
jgi:hypothetical protein